MTEGKIVGMLGNVHIYENHKEGAYEQIKRKPKVLPTVSIRNFGSIFDWKSDEVELNNYEHLPSIKFPIAV